jgi:hypothetical protein
MNPEIDRDHIAALVELRGVYDGWSVAVMDDGRRLNRWTGVVGMERRAALTDAFLAGEPANGRWF